LGRDMRAYMHVLNVGKTIGFVPQPHYKAIGGREFCDVSLRVWHLLELHLRHVQAADFPANGWLDGFRFDEIRIFGRDEVSVFGLVTWVQGQEHWWLDPGSISNRFLPDTHIVAHNSVAFGDRAIRLAKRPYVHGAALPPKPEAWLFEFDGPRLSGLNA
jgi:hypothetical protein